MNASNSQKSSSKVLLLSNERSIRYTWPIFLSMASQLNPITIAITETWLPEDIVKQYTYLDNNQLSVCRPVRRGGGAFLLFHPMYKVVRAAVQRTPPPSCDALAAVDMGTGHCWVIVYRSLDCSPSDTTALCDYFDAIRLCYRNVSIISDLIMRYINWQNLSSQYMRPFERDFLNFCSSWNLTQAITQPTRGYRQLDIILTTCPELFGTVSVQPLLISSDHDAVVCLLRSRPKRTVETKFVRSFVQANYNSIALSLSLMNWPDVFRGFLTANDYWIIFYRILCKLADQFVSLRFMRRGNRLGHCLPKPVRKLLLSKRRAWRRWKSTPTPASKAAFICASRACRSAIAQFRAEQKDCLLTAGSRKFFTHVSHRLNPSD